MKLALIIAIVLTSASAALAKPTVFIDCYTRDNNVYEIENWTHDSKGILFPSGNLRAGQVVVYHPAIPLVDALKALNVKCTFLSPADVDATPAPVVQTVGTAQTAGTTQTANCYIDGPNAVMVINGMGVTGQIVYLPTAALATYPVKCTTTIKADLNETVPLTPLRPRFSLAVAPNMTDKAGSLSGAGVNVTALFPRSPVTLDLGVLLRKPCKENGKTPHEDHQTTCSTAYLPDFAVQFHLYDNLGMSLGSSVKSGKWSRFFWLINVGIGR
jgi:hypothetical protein